LGNLQNGLSTLARAPIEDHKKMPDAIDVQTQDMIRDTLPETSDRAQRASLEATHRTATSRTTQNRVDGTEVQQLTEQQHLGGNSQNSHKPYKYTEPR
jgi:hypothetical protein